MSSTSGVATTGTRLGVAVSSTPNAAVLPSTPAPAVDQLFLPTKDFLNIPLREDHATRPLWVCPNKHIFLETYSAMYKQAYDFLIAISEPVSRPKYIHEYVVTRYSLNTAASLGLTTEDILRGLRKMSKTEVSSSIVEFIKKNTANCGKVKILLKNRRYYIESLDSGILQKLVSDPVIMNARRDSGPYAAPITIYTPPPPSAPVPTIASNLSALINAANGTGPPINLTLNANIGTTMGTSMANSNSNTVVSSSAQAIIAADLAAAQAREVRDPSTGFMISEIFDDAIMLQGTGTIEETLGDKEDESSAVSAVTPGESGGVVVDELDEHGKVIRRRKLRKIDQRKAMGLIDDDEEEDEADEVFYDDETIRRTTTTSTSTSTTLVKTENDALAKTKTKTKAKKYVYSIEVASELVEKVRRRADDMGFPMLEEYDFRRDAAGADQILPASLKPSAQIREYQEKALSKMFGNGRARSGIIVLPCGAGKTLVGITAMSTIGRSTLIVCSTSVAVQQWKNQVRLWTHLPPEHITTLTQGSKEMPNKEAKVIITTYPMLAHSQKRSAAAEEMMRVIKTQEWGLILLDEVHVAPADKFKICVEQTHSRCKLGLTATLVREDEKINDLFFLLGPKLYEANWMDLSSQGFIATVKCIEIWCPMPPAFYGAYLEEPDHKKRLSLCVANPEKINTLEALIRMHEARGDKIMVFSEQKFILELLARAFGTFFIHGDVPHLERMGILRQFGSNGPDRINTIFISKIGDNSIDLPDTNVIIQLSAHYSSRRQEAQRLGRILRPKSRKSGSIDAFFYTLITQDTEELRYGTKRQRFLVDQGYAYEVKRSSEAHMIAREFIKANSSGTGSTSYPPYKYSSPKLQEEILREIRRDTNYGEEGAYEDDPLIDDDQSASGVTPGSYVQQRTTGARRSDTSMAALSGATKRGYQEMSGSNRR